MERSVPPSGEQPQNTPASSSPPSEAPRAEVVNREVVGRENVPVEGAGRENAAREDSAREGVGREGVGREEPRTFASHDAPVAPERQRATGVQKRILAWTWMGVFSMGVYALSMMLAFFSPGYTLVDRIASLFLVSGVLFVMMHGLGYANSMIKASWGYNEVRRRIFTPQTAPLVDCIVACFNEPREVLEETVAQLANLDYANKRIVILDDSTKEESRLAAREIGALYGAEVIQRTNRRGYKAGAINDYIKGSKADFVAIFDADALAAHNFLRDVVPIIQENPRLAFVQTPQHYANTGVSSVAMGAARQQSVFYEYICEGKAYSRAAFCCGTNVVFRRDALLDVGGFDEASVTEDFTTSLNLHLKNWDSTYYNQIYVYSMAPETLAAYFTQQGRWAFGSVGAMRKVLGSAIKSGPKMRLGQWWEYFLSSTYYWVGWVNFVFMLLPILYIFFGVKPLRQDVFTYLAIFVPYLVFTMNMFYQGMEERGYKVSDTILGQQINFACFPVHMSSAVAGLFGRKRPFGVTPKGVGGRSSWLSLWPQLLMLVLSLVAFVWGMYKYIVGIDRNTAAIVINSVWALYHVFLLSGIFRLNRPFHSQADTGRTFSSRARAMNADGSPSDEMAPVGAARGNTGANPVFGTTRGDGTVVAPPRVRPHRVPVGRGARMALGIMALSLLGIGATALTVGKWYLSPQIPVNVYVLDRTTGRDYQEHRSLMWTLNFLKVAKQPQFGPEPSAARSNYSYSRDFFGFIPGDPSTAVKDPTNQGDLLVRGRNIPLPDRLETPGALVLADSYGEFVEYDYRKEKYVRYRNEERGISPSEVDRIEDFYNRGGLLVGEWNTIGYPTLPSEYEDSRSWVKGLADVRRALDYVQKTELPQREAALEKSLAGPPAVVQRLEADVERSRQSIEQAKRSIRELEARLAQADTLAEQIAAQQRLERALHVDYLGWYGRYVDKFEEEREYDFRLWKNVQDQLRKQFPNDPSKHEPRGPGFVFYKDGPSQIFNPETKQFEENPFSRPVILTGVDLRGTNTTQLATVNRNPKFADDPLLQGVAEQTPLRFWFDVVRPLGEAQALSFYKLLVKPSGTERLRAAGFPARYLKDGSGGNSQIVFPASIAYRENQKLRSFYFAGDASDYTLVSRVNELVPATGGIASFLGARTGPFPMQYYWNYYQPILHNIFHTTPDIRYGSANQRS
jgi:cellulose synthase (UDP-forming)